LKRVPGTSLCFASLSPLLLQYILLDFGNYVDSTAWTVEESGTNHCLGVRLAVTPRNGDVASVRYEAEHRRQVPNGVHGADYRLTNVSREERLCM